MSNFKNLETIDEWLDSELDDGCRELLKGEQIVQNVSNAIHNDRISKKMSQKDYAAWLGISQAMISKIENANFNPTIEALSKIAYKLDFEFALDFGPSSKISMSSLKSQK